MKIVSWNCRCGFNKKKSELIDKYAADIYVIQECTKEDVENLKDFKIHSIWYGDNIDSKYGVAIFSDAYNIELLPEMNPDFRYVIPFRIFDENNSFVLFAVWTKDKDKNNNKIEYTAPVWEAINYDKYKEIYSKNVILIGDFNSNNLWENQYKLKKVPSQQDIINKLQEYFIKSAYHKYFNCRNGQEKHPTLLWQMNKESAFHIDYCFVSKYFIIKSVQIGSVNEWEKSKLSDHCPLIVDLQNRNGDLKYEDLIPLCGGITTSKELDEKILENLKKQERGEISEEELVRLNGELIDEDNRKRAEEINKIIADAKASGVTLPEGLEDEVIPLAPRESEIQACLNYGNSRDRFYEKYKSFYDQKHKEYEEDLKSMGEMTPVNRNIPADIEDRINNSLLSQKYIVAKTMPKNPHQYCLRKNWTGEISFEEVVDAMRNYGYVEWFYGKPYMMYNIENFKYWTMGFPIEVTILINRTTIEKYSFEEFCKIIENEIKKPTEEEISNCSMEYLAKNNKPN